MESVVLGRTGLTVSRLAFGTGTNSVGHRSDQTDLGLEGLADLLRLAYDLGVTFWDTADAYGSQPHVARALAGLPRERVVIATKIAPRSGRAMTRAVNRILKELRTDVLDVVLQHCLTEVDWPERYIGAMEALSRAREQGKVRAVGVSCHSLGALEAAERSDWTEVVLARINFAGLQMDGSPEDVRPILERLHAAGKAVYAMKVMGCGPLGDRARAAIEYVLRLGTVGALSIGMVSAEQVRQNAGLVEELAPQYPLWSL